MKRQSYQEKENCNRCDSMRPYSLQIPKGFLCKKCYLKAEAKEKVINGVIKSGIYPFSEPGILKPEYQQQIDKAHTEIDLTFKDN